MEPHSSTATLEGPTGISPKKTVPKSKASKLKVNLKAKARTTEMHTSEHTIEQPAPLFMPGFNQPLPEKPSSIQAVDSPLTKEYQSALAFAEEPVTVIITPSQDPNAATFRECWVNGRGIEVLIGNAWQEWKAIPTGAQIVTKRKYVEVLLRAKQDHIKTNIVKYEHHEDNQVKHNLVLMTHLTVVHDPAGVARGTKGGEWFHRLVSAQN